MNSVLNSDSEQCPESKLGWVHQVHTLALPEHTSLSHCAQASHVTDVSWAVWQPVAGRVPSLGDRIVTLCHRAPARAAAHRVTSLQRRIVALPAPCRACVAIQPSGQAARCIATHKATPQHQYNLYRDSPWPVHALVTIQMIVS